MVDSARRIDEAEATAWEGWLSRLAASITASRGVAVVRPEESAELSLGKADRHVGPLTRLKRVVVSVGPILYTVIFWLLVGGWLGRLLLNATLGWGPSTVVGWVVGFATFVFVAVAAIAVLGVLAVPMMRLVGTQLRVLASVAPSGPAGAADRVTVRVDVAARRWGFVGPAYLCRWLVGLKRRIVATMPASPDPLRVDVPKTIKRGLRGARTLRVHEFVLRVAPPISAGAWEGVLGLGHVDERKGMASTIPTLREYPTRGSRPAARKPSRVALLCAPPFALFCEEAWSAGDLSPDIFFAEQLPELEQQRGVDVLHLIGSPVPGELRPTLALQGAGGDGVLPDRLPLPGPSVIVVQAEPIRSSVTADPRSGELRELAHDLAVASRGAAVIALPALPSHLATALVSEIAVNLTHAPPRRQTYLDLVHALRTQIYAAGEAGEPVSARALPAFDVCLYVAA